MFMHRHANLMSSLQNARMLQQKLDQPVSAPPSPRDPQAMIVDGDTANNLVQNIQALKAEVARLQNQLKAAQTERKGLTCLFSFRADGIFKTSFYILHWKGLVEVNG